MHRKNILKNIPLEITISYLFGNNVDDFQSIYLFFLIFL